MAATRLPATDVAIVGMGLVGSIMARELTRAGMEVVGIERGEPRFTVPDFQGPAMHDELRYSVRKGLMQDNTREAVTFRNRDDETALPVRRWESFLPGTGLGGAAVHWNGQTWRFQESDLRMRSHFEQRYGKRFIPDELLVQDWGVTAGELEHHFDRFEYLMGVSGQAGNVNGQRLAGGNPFEDPRSRPYPTPPQKEPYGSALFRKAAASLGYSPFPMPSCNLSQPYTNPEGLQMNACMFCGFCERYGCEHYAKSSPQTVLLPVLMKERRFTLRTQSQVLNVMLDKSGRQATGVRYVDASGREFEQPASMVIVASFALNNVRMLLLSGIGKPYEPARADSRNNGTVGRGYAYQTISGATVFFDRSVNINPFMRSGASGTVISQTRPPGSQRRVTVPPSWSCTVCSMTREPKPRRRGPVISSIPQRSRQSRLSIRCWPSSRQLTCSSPPRRDRAPYFIALVASSCTAMLSGCAACAAMVTGGPFSSAYGASSRMPVRKAASSPSSMARARGSSASRRSPSAMASSSGISRVWS